MLTNDEKTILVVEDELPIAEIIAMILEYEGYHVLTARDGRAALACLEQTKVDLVLSDVMMPVMDGVELCRQMAASVAHNSIPVVLMSAVYRFARLDGCECAAFIRKPFELEQLIEAVASVLEDYEAARSKKKQL